MSEFTEFIEEALGDRTIDQVVQTAKEKGFTISRSAAYKYRSGHVTKPDPVTLNALAAGLGVDPRKLRRLAGLPAGELGPWAPPSAAASLTQAQRDALDMLIKAIVSGEGESSAGTDEPPKKSGGPGGKPGPGGRPDLSVVEEESYDGYLDEAAFRSKEPKGVTGVDQTGPDD